MRFAAGLLAGFALLAGELAVLAGLPLPGDAGGALAAGFASPEAGAAVSAGLASLVGVAVVAADFVSPDADAGFVDGAAALAAGLPLLGDVPVVMAGALVRPTDAFARAGGVATVFDVMSVVVVGGASVGSGRPVPVIEAILPIA